MKLKWNPSRSGWFCIAGVDRPSDSPSVGSSFYVSCVCFEVGLISLQRKKKKSRERETFFFSPHKSCFLILHTPGYKKNHTRTLDPKVLSYSLLYIHTILAKVFHSTPDFVCVILSISSFLLLLFFKKKYFTCRHSDSCLAFSPSWPAWALVALHIYIYYSFTTQAKTNRKNTRNNQQVLCRCFGTSFSF